MTEVKKISKRFSEKLDWKKASQIWRTSGITKVIKQVMELL